MNLKQTSSKSELLQSAEMLEAAFRLESLASIGRRFQLSTAQVKLRATLVAKQIAMLKSVPLPRSMKYFLSQYNGIDADFRKDIEHFRAWISNASEVAPIIFLNEQAKGDLAGLSNRVIDTLKFQLNISKKSELISAVNSGKINLSVPNLGKKCLAEIAEFLKQTNQVE